MFETRWTGHRKRKGHQGATHTSKHRLFYIKRENAGCCGLVERNDGKVILLDQTGRVTQQGLLLLRYVVCNHSTDE